MKAIRYLKYPVLALVLLFLLLQTAVQLGRDFAVQWLLDQGAESAQIHSLSINWFTGSVRLYGVHIQTPEQPDLLLEELRLQLDYGALFKQRILIKELTITGLHGDLRQDKESAQLFIGPVGLPQSDDETASEPEDRSPWLFGLRRMTVVDLRWQARLNEGDHTLSITEGELNTFYMWYEQAITALKLNGSVNGASFTLDSTGQPLPDTKTSDMTMQITGFPVHSITAPFVPELRATLTTNLKLSVTMGETISLQQQGDIAVDNLRWEDAEQLLNLDRFSWQGDSQIQLQDGVAQQVVLKGQTSGNGIAFSNADLTMNVAEQRWQGTAELSFSGSGLDKIVLSNDLTIDQVKLEQGDQLRLALAKTNWRGPLSIKNLSAEPLFRGESGQLAFNGLSISAVEGEKSLLRLTEAKVSDVTMDWPQQVRAATVEISDVRITETAEETLASLDLNLQQLDYRPEQLAISKVTLNNLLLSETLTEDKQPRNLQGLQQLIADLTKQPGKVEEPVETSTEKTESESLRITVPLIEVTGDSRIAFSDLSTKPDFKSELKINKAQITGLDTAVKKPAKFELGLQLNGFTTLELAGNTDLAAGGENASWKGQLKQLDLPRLSPYSIATTGYYLQNGQLQLDAEGTLKEGQIEGKNHVQINRLEVEVADQDQMGKFSQKLSMPLGTAIGILQDSDDNIDLDIPVSGSLDDPDFGFQSVINRLAGKGLKQAAFSFLTRSLQPYGALISLAASAAKDGAFINLQPVSFAPGQAELDDTARDYLSKISAMMLERKGMRLNICGQVVQQDQLLIRQSLEESNRKLEKPLAPEALSEQETEQMIQLAQQRSDAIKTMLNTEIAGERLFNCFPVPALDDPAMAPTATLGL